jgi:hypothetical protein
MSGRETKGTNIEKGLVARVAAGMRLAVTGKIPEGWFGPEQPLDPVAPASVAGRAFDYPFGYNLNTEPRGGDSDGKGSAPVTFEQLRNLADNYDMMRLVIETRKDQLAKCEWIICPKDLSKKAESDPRCKELTDFLAMPDKEHDFDTWLRMLVEDMLVIDASTLYPRKTKGGKIYALEPVDGATIKRVLDDAGRTPIPPQPAYQQILKGLPAVSYRRDELLYLPRNVRTNRVYAYGPVEQVIMTVNIALRRQLHQLQYYTEGNVPEALVGVPETWNPDQIAQFQAYFDSLLEGDTAQRRHMRFVPGSISKGYVATKDAALKDEYDEWLARIICYAFSVSNQWAVKQMNRSTSDNAQEQALQEGLGPLMKWVKTMMNRILVECFGYADLQFMWKEEQVIAPDVQAQINDTKVARGGMTLDEWRQADGQEALPDGLGAEPLIFTATGAVRLRDVVNPPPPPPPPPQLGHNGGPPLEEEPEPPPAPEPNNEKPLKKSAAQVDHYRESVQAGRRVLQHTFTMFFVLQAQRCAEAAAKVYGDLKKAAGADDSEPVEPAPAETEVSGIAEAVISAAIDPTAWQKAAETVIPVLEEAAEDGAEAGAEVIGIDLSSATKLVNKQAVSWAKEHAVELVQGLEQTTRDALRGLVAKAEEEGWAVERLKKAILDNYAFSPERAQLIAQHELATADIMGNLIAWRAARDSFGIKLKKRWIEYGDLEHCPACDLNVKDGAIDLDDEFSSGAQAAPAHPHCTCDTVSEVAQDDEEEASD